MAPIIGSFQKLVNFSALSFYWHLKRTSSKKISGMAICVKVENEGLTKKRFVF